MNVEVIDDALVIGLYAFRNVKWEFEYESDCYNIYFDLIGPGDDEYWPHNGMGKDFWRGLWNLVHRRPKYLHMYNGITEESLRDTLIEFLKNRSK